MPLDTVETWGSPRVFVVILLLGFWKTKQKQEKKPKALRWVLMSVQGFKLLICKHTLRNVGDTTGTLVCFVFTLNVMFTPSYTKWKKRKKKCFMGSLKQTHSTIYFCLLDFIPPPLACFIFETDYKVPLEWQSVWMIYIPYIPKCKCMVCNWCNALFVLKVPVDWVTPL